MNLNIMMDGSMYPDSWHPCRDYKTRDYSGDAEHYSRTQRPPKYYFIDFGISRRFSPDDKYPLAYPILGGDKSAPEFKKSADQCNPFPTDIYYLGNMIRQDFLQVSARSYFFCYFSLNKPSIHRRSWGSNLLMLSLPI
jgi:hypothetical protein